MGPCYGRKVRYTATWWRKARKVESTSCIEAQEPVKMLAQCRKCGRETDNSDGWWVLAVVAASGARSGYHWSVVPTRTDGFLVCPACQLTPWAEGLRAALSDPFMVPVIMPKVCAVTCVRPWKRWRITTAAAYRWERRFGRLPASAHCPECLGPATVRHLEGAPKPRLFGRV